LDPLFKTADARLRGIALHEVMERLFKTDFDPFAPGAEARMTTLAALVMGESVPWPSAQRLWTARVKRIAPGFVRAEQARRAEFLPSAVELSGKLVIDPPGVTLIGRLDRLDQAQDGRVQLYDYKTGTAPSKAQQKEFDKQLLLSIEMVERGGFDLATPGTVEAAEFLPLKAGDKPVPAPRGDAPDFWKEFTELLRHMLSDDFSWTARRAMVKDADRSDYDHLSRLGEWQVTDEPRRVPL
ncbi:MAG: RecB family exonuclease, partial [Shimia sp.]